MPRKFVLFVLALALALVGTGGVFSYVTAADARAAAGQDLVEVLVAKKLVPAGTTAQQATDDGLVAPEQYPRRTVPAGALDDLTDFRTWTTVADVQPGEVLLRAKFVDPATTGRLAIPRGRMGVAVELSDPARVAGFVQPGSEVAVFATIDRVEADVKVSETGPSSANVTAEGDDKHTRLLLARAPVIGVGETSTRKLPRDDEDEDGEVAQEQVKRTILTLGLTQAEAQRLVHAATTGELYFALLTKDSATAPAAGVDNRTLFD